MDTSATDFVCAGGFEELKAKGRLVVHGPHRPILVVHDKDRVFALDNRCPHMGFPLDRGSVEDGTLTCHWHHARDGHPVGAHTSLGKASDFVRQLLGHLTRLSVGRNSLTGTDAAAFLCADLAAGEDDVERAPLADQARQTDGPAIDERYAPTSAIHADVSGLRHDAQITPECQ